MHDNSPCAWFTLQESAETHVEAIAWQQDWTQLYIDWYTFPIWYLPLSLFAALFIHDTYYYFLHRWMHLSRTAFLYVHKVHHDSIITNAMTSFSFHPLESIFQAAIIPVIIFLLPMHLGVLLILLFLIRWASIWLNKTRSSSSRASIVQALISNNFPIIQTLKLQSQGP